jgi:hypothetical protein
MGSPEPGLQLFMEGTPELTFADRLEVSLLHQSVHAIGSVRKYGPAGRRFHTDGQNDGREGIGCALENT